MADGYVRKLGHIIDADGAAFSVGVDHDLVTIWPGEHDDSHRYSTLRLAADAAEEFARLFVSAVWQAGQQAGRLEEVVDAEIVDEPGGCICGRTVAVCAQAGREAGNG